MNTPELAEKINQLLVEIFELKQTIDALAEAPPELVERMAKVSRTAKALDGVLPEM